MAEPGPIRASAHKDDRKALAKIAAGQVVGTVQSRGSMRLAARRLGARALRAPGGRVAALDPLFNVLWSICGDTGTVQCHNPTTHDMELEGKQNIMTPDLALPVTPGCLVSRSQAALNLLSCLDTITSSPATLTHCEEENTRLGTAKSYSKEDFSIVNRFDSHGGGCGHYSRCGSDGARSPAPRRPPEC